MVTWQICGAQALSCSLTTKLRTGEDFSSYPITFGRSTIVNSMLWCRRHQVFLCAIPVEPFSHKWEHLNSIFLADAQKCVMQATTFNTCAGVTCLSHNQQALQLLDKMVFLAYKRHSLLPRPQVAMTTKHATYGCWA